MTSVITSLVVGGLLYSKFSSRLEDSIALIESEVTMTQNSLANSRDTFLGNASGRVLFNQADVVNIVKKAGPSIVGIRMTYADPVWRGAPGNVLGEGSGIIVTGEGHIMTNYHVVQQGDPKNPSSKNIRIEVFLPDERQATAQFIGGDSLDDLAVIKIDLDNLPVAELGDSSKLEVGEMAVAIGNPLGMEFAGSVTVGVISALNRTISTQDITLNLIQTDAAINPGNSGGALLNSQGEVIGVNSIKISVAGVEGLGFAIPINTAVPIVNQLIKYGFVKGRPLIGISGREITEAVARYYDIPLGIYVTEVAPGTGADKAGIKVGDIITQLAGEEIEKMSDVNRVKNKYKAGDTVEIIVVRDGRKIKLNITFSEER